MIKNLPYGKQTIETADIEAVVDVLKSDYLTQGPKVKEFEHKFGEKIKNPLCSALCNATAGLHITYQALGLQQGDVLWTVPNSFVATANAARFLGADVDFVDIDPDTFCISIDALKLKLKQTTKLPKIVVPVHFAGASCDMKEIYKLSLQYGFKIVEDAAHAVGAYYDDSPIGSCKYSDAAVFSFHPVKIITTGEGGMVAVKDKNVHDNIQQLLTHGITKDHHKMENKSEGAWFYEMQFLGYNYRITDIQAALGISQLSRLDENIKRRKQIAEIYHDAFHNLPVKLQKIGDDIESSWHLFVLLLKNEQERRKVFDSLRSINIYAQIHYIPIHTQPYYRKLGFNWGDFPIAEDYYKKCISIPMYHGLTNEEQAHVIATLKALL